MTDAADAAALWGATLTRPLRLRENEVYEVQTPMGRAALRLHRVGYQTAETIRSELWWCDALGKAGLPVPAPVPLGDGAVFARLGSGRLASVVTWVMGAPLGEAGVPLPGAPRDQADLHHALGRLLGQVHRATDAQTLPDFFVRPSWGHDGLVGEAPLWGRFWDHPALTAPDRATLMAARGYLSDRLQKSASPLGLIHADVLRENVFVNRGALTLIDFDDSGFGYRWFDLGTVLSQCLYEPAYPEIRAALIEGYASVTPVNATEVDTFTLARTLASVGWAATRLAPDHPVNASHIARAVSMARACMG
jgi:Ser/Thr protein kinase RdoA (MazF antagonist)